MNRIAQKFAELKNKGRKALITFVTAGDPDLDTTVELVRQMEENGADLIELGVPYSDPVAEGPVIQSANARALKNSIRISGLMRAVSRMRETVKVPLLYLLYFNCILQYGPSKFFRDCRNSGIDGVIVPDLPYEECFEIKDIAAEFGVYIITLVSPTSRHRVDEIAKNAEGFLYCVSSLGVTGMRKDFDTDFDEFFTYVNKAAKIPTAIGFGISTTEHVKRLKNYSDGLIVGSAIVKKIENSMNPTDAINNVNAFVRELRAALDEE
jgi:tryptophan synthase alpha chain